MRYVGKTICVIIGIYLLSSLGFNLYVYFHQLNTERPFEVGWYKFEEAHLSTDKEIYGDLTKSIKKNDSIFVSMFQWPRMEGKKVHEGLDVKLASYLNQMDVRGDVYIDPFGFLYKTTTREIESNPVVQAAPHLNWLVYDHPFELPNNVIMWIFCNSLISKTLNSISWTFPKNLYLFLKSSVNHQKIVILNQGNSGAWIGSKNFDDDIGWYSNDDFLFLKGDLAKVLYFECLSSINRIEGKVPILHNLLMHAKEQISSLPTFTYDLGVNPPEPQMGKILRNSEIRNAMLKLIEESKEIKISIFRLVDHSIIKALNKAADQGAKVEVILDADNTILGIRAFKYAPNVVSIKDLNKNIAVKVVDMGQFNMHVKAALFTLKNEQKIYFVDTGNWSYGSLDRMAFNDMSAMILPPPEVEAQFIKQFEGFWNQAKERGSLKIKAFYFKYYMSKFTQLTGLAPW